MISIRIDASDFQRVARKLEQLGMDSEKVIREETHKALDRVKPEAEAAITARYNVGSANLRVEKTGDGGSIVGEGGMIDVTEMAPNQVGKTVSVEIIRGNRRTITPESRGPGVSGAFMAKGRVFERRQSSRFPIFPVSTIGIPQMLYYKGISDPMTDKLAEYAMEGIEQRIFAGL